MRAPFDPVRHRVRNAGHLRAALSAGWVIRSTYILEKDGHRQAFEGKFWTQLWRRGSLEERVDAEGGRFYVLRGSPWLPGTSPPPPPSSPSPPTMPGASSTGPAASPPSSSDGGRDG
jgi:hypothetical protein